MIFRDAEVFAHAENNNSGFTNHIIKYILKVAVLYDYWQN